MCNYLFYFYISVQILSNFISAGSKINQNLIGNVKQYNSSIDRWKMQRIWRFYFLNMFFSWLLFIFSIKFWLILRPHIFNQFWINFTPCGRKINQNLIKNVKNIFIWHFSCFSEGRNLLARESQIRYLYFIINIINIILFSILID